MLARIAGLTMDALVLVFHPSHAPLAIKMPCSGQNTGHQAMTTLGDKLKFRPITHPLLVPGSTDRLPRTMPCTLCLQLSSPSPHLCKIPPNNMSSAHTLSGQLNALKIHFKMGRNTSTGKGKGLGFRKNLCVGVGVQTEGAVRASARPKSVGAGAEVHTADIKGSDGRLSRQRRCVSLLVLLRIRIQRPVHCNVCAQHSPATFYDLASLPPAFFASGHVRSEHTFDSHCNGIYTLLNSTTLTSDDLAQGSLAPSHPPYKSFLLTLGTLFKIKQ